MLPSFADDRIVITEPVWVEDRGSKHPTYPGPGVTVDGCSVQPGVASEDLQLRDNVIVRYTAFIPPGTPVTRHARVTFEGDDYAIEGVPLRHKSPTGAVSHILAALIDWEG